jgi:hypothetical protein
VTPVRVVYRKYDGSLHWHMELGRLSGNQFGTSVALSAAGSTALVGAIGYDSYAGAGYVFTPGRLAGWLELPVRRAVSLVSVPAGDGSAGEGVLRPASGEFPISSVRLTAGVLLAGRVPVGPAAA